MPFSASHRDSFLSVEPLEERQMLSTVAIDAVGTTGEEILVVTANGSGDAEKVSGTFLVE